MNNFCHKQGKKRQKDKWLQQMGRGGFGSQTAADPPLRLVTLQNPAWCEELSSSDNPVSLED